MSGVRKYFNYDCLTETQTTKNKKPFTNTISAGGCLFYKPISKQLLLIKYTDPNWPRLDDLGGQVDLTDNTVYETISREVAEETNQIINPEIMKSFQSSQIEHFYTPESKYYFILVSVGEDFFPETTIFGTSEQHDQIARTIHWFPITEVKDQLAWRLLKNPTLRGIIC